MSVRYWAYFAAKLIVAAAVLYGSLSLLDSLAPHDYDPSASDSGRSVTYLPGSSVLKNHPQIPVAAQENAGRPPPTEKPKVLWSPTPKSRWKIAQLF